MNDASTDETVSVLADMEDSRIHIHSLPENQGVGAARNAAIRMSSGELASFLDDDDEYDENFLERTADVFSRGGPPGLTWTGVEFVRDESEVALRRRKSGRHPHGKRVQRPGGPPRDLVSSGLSYGVTRQRKILEGVGALDETLRVAQDTDFFLRYLASGNRFEPIPEVLVRHHVHSGERLTGQAHDRLRLQVLRTLLARHQETISRNALIHETLTGAEGKLSARLNG